MPTMPLLPRPVGWTGEWPFAPSEDTSTPDPVPALLWPRGQRDALLSLCDYKMISDYSLTELERAQWTAYRQALRDLPTTCPDPHSITWPVPPT